MELPKFELFENPVGEKAIERSDVACDVCGEARGWIAACKPYGENDGIEHVCPWCIAEGRAAERGCIFNNARRLDRPLGGTARLTGEDRRLVEGRTPQFVTWQDHGWVACCGRAAVYLGEADAEDLREGGKWAAAAESVVADTYGLGWSDEDRERMLGAVKRGAGPCAYIFRCRVCAGLVGFWDVH